MFFWAIHADEMYATRSRLCSRITGVSGGPDELPFVNTKSTLTFNHRGERKVILPALLRIKL